MRLTHINSPIRGQGTLIMTGDAFGDGYSSTLSTISETIECKNIKFQQTNLFWDGFIGILLC